MSKQEKRWRLVLKNMRLTLVAFAAPHFTGAGRLHIDLPYSASQRYDTGSALSCSYAAEESDNLAVFETLLSFGGRLRWTGWQPSVTKSNWLNGWIYILLV